MPTTLQAGDEGVLVERLQVALVAYGYDLGLSGISGSFDEQTKDSVTSFQEAKGLNPTGVADEETIAAMDLDPDTLEDLIEIEPTSPTWSSATQVATIDGDDIYLDPPVRLWPQYDTRWRGERIGGPRTGRMLDWISNGCNASSAAMILRWFAEDCSAGTIEFPTKPGSAIDPSWYGLRLGEALWPNADPPGKVELTPAGRIHFRKLYSVAAQYLKTGEIERNEAGNAIESTESTAHYVTRQPSGGWMDLIRTLLETGPVIVGIGAPAGHFVVAHGIVGGSLLVVDPGGVLHQAHNGGNSEIQDWSGKNGYVSGSTDPAQVRMPEASQWAAGSELGQERDPRSYHLLSGQFLDDLLARLISVTSLSYPEGAQLQ